jgi:hypothetical protein
MIGIDPRALAQALGGEARGNRVQAPGPGHSKQDRSLSILIDPYAPDGFLVESFAGDDWRECKEHVRRRLGLPTCPQANCRQGTDRAAVRPPLRHEKQSDADRMRCALSLWSATQPPKGSLVESYLAARGLSLPDEVIRADALRFHPACPFGADRYPAMIALMCDIRTNEPKAIHRTALKPDGSGKLEIPGASSKRMLGPAAGSAVKLIEDAEVTLGLGIAEGIENALTAICAGWSPVWATAGKGLLKNFPVLAGIEALTVFADPEPGGVQAAHQCARRWHEAGREGTVIEPKWAGSDLNDLLGYAR